MADKKVNFKQLGVSGLDRHAGYVFEEFLPELRYPRASKVYHEMASNDPVIGAILYTSEMLIRKVHWTVTPASDSDADREAAEFLESCMDDMSMSWASTINEILSMFTYGFSFHEVIYKVRRGPNETNPKYKSKYSDCRIGWRKIAPRAQSTLHSWEFDEEGDVRAFVQQAPPFYNQATIPLTKGLLFRTNVSRDNPEGKSLLRNAYRPWYFKKRIEEIEAIGIERDLAGLPTLTAPEGVDIWDDDIPNMAALRTNAEMLVQNVRRDAAEGILLPHGWDFKLASTGGARQFDTNAIINRYDNRIAITMLSDIVLIGGSTSGSFALADTKKSMLAAALEAHVNNIADVFNQHAVPQLFSLNHFPDITDLPTITPGEVEKVDIKEIALLLRSMGLDISKDLELQNHLRKVASIPSLSKSQFEEIYQQQTEVDGETNIGNNNTSVGSSGASNVGNNNTSVAFNDDDTIDNDFEQNDLNYMGQ